MKKIYDSASRVLRYAIIFIAFICKGVNAQSFTPDVIGSAGTFATSASGSMSWTIGEVMTETYSSANNFFTQGFHQPDTSAVVAVTNLSMENISIFPNPVFDNLTIDFSKASGNFAIELFDALGNRIIGEKNIPANTTLHKLSIAPLAEGIYFLNIINTDSNNRQSYKINKLK